MTGVALERMPGAARVRHLILAPPGRTDHLACERMIILDGGRGDHWRRAGSGREVDPGGRCSRAFTKKATPTPAPSVPRAAAETFRRNPLFP